MHLPECSRCRDEIRAIARLNRHLLKPNSVEFAPDFESNFRAALMARMVTSNEVRSFRRVLDAKRLVAVAAGILIAVFGWQLFYRDVSVGVRSGPPKTMHLAPTLTAAMKAEASFDQFLTENRGSREHPSGGQIHRFQFQFAKSGLSLVGHIASRLNESSRAEEQTLYRVLGATKSQQSWALLRRRLSEKSTDSQIRSVILESIVQQPSVEAARLIRREAEKKLSFGEAFRLLTSMPSRFYWPELEILCRENLTTSPKQVISSLASLGSPKAESLLLDLHLEGLQSDVLTAPLVQRRGVISKSKQIVAMPHAAPERRRRAIFLLGKCKDEGSAEMLMDLVNDPKVGSEAFRALSQIASTDAMLKIVHQLPLVEKRRLSRREEERLHLIEYLVRELGPAGLEFFSQLALEGDRSGRPQYVKALGLLGTEKTLPILYSLAKSPELREFAIGAVIRIGSPRSVSFLQIMVRDANLRIRRLAREGLKKLTPSRPKQKWRGFARVLAQACVIAPRMV